MGNDCYLEDDGNNLAGNLRKAGYKIVSARLYCIIEVYTLGERNALNLLSFLLPAS